MEDNKLFEERLREELKRSGNNINPSHDLYTDIMTNVNINNKGSFFMFKHRFKKIKPKYAAAALLCLTLALGGGLFSSSKSFHAFAEETMNKIKTIFIMDGSNKIVEKDPSKLPLKGSVNKDSTLSDTELTKKVGFKVIFPDSLSDGLKLKYKTENINIENFDYNNAQMIQKLAVDAIDDESKFKNLSEFNPTRGVGAVYAKAEGANIYLIINPVTSEKDKHEKQTIPPDAKKLIINNLKGYWLDIPIPNYPIIEKNGIKQQDFTQKPTKIETAHKLTWLAGDLYFEMIIEPNQNLSMEEVQGAANMFMESYNK